MKITLLYNTSSDQNLNLDRIIEIIMNVLTELGLTIKEIDLNAVKIPYFNGKSNEHASSIINDIRDSSGVIFASAARLPLISAPFSVLLEYLTFPEYSDVLHSKNCLLLIATENGGERSALESISRVLQTLGAYDCLKIGLQHDDIDKITSIDEYRGIFEKLLEDFYRIIRQNRKFFIPLDYSRKPVEIINNQNTENNELKSDPNNDKKQKLSINELTKKLNLDHLDENQTEDINEISDYFNKIITERHQTDNMTPIFVKSLSRDLSNVTPNLCSCKQLTKSLTHHFQPQLSHGLNAVIQLQVSGEETFMGFLTIQNTECTYTEGASLNPDISIITDCSIWRDVCDGKFSAQKAFMIGRLKVRGNFVLLTKFDHLFHLTK